jgi:hypothetical protein
MLARMLAVFASVVASANCVTDCEGDRDLVYRSSGPMPCDRASAFFTASARSSTFELDDYAGPTPRLTLVAIEARGAGGGTPSLKSATVVPAAGFDIRILETRANDQLLEVDVDSTKTGRFNLQINFAEPCESPSAGGDASTLTMFVNVLVGGPDGGGDAVLRSGFISL